MKFQWRLAWAYDGGAGKPMLFEFDKDYGSVDRADYYLAEPYCNDRDSDLYWGQTLAPYDPVIGQYYIACGMGSVATVWYRLEARASARRTADAAWHSESRVAGFDQALGAHWNLYAFQAPSSPELVGYLSIPADSIRPAPRVATRSVELGVLLSVGDPVTETITQLDTTLVFASGAPLPHGATLHWALPIRTPPNENARVTMTVRNHVDATQGEVSATTWALPAFDGTLLLSDLVVAEPRAGILHRGSHAIAPLAGHAVLEVTPFRLYYELYGAGAGDPLSVMIRITPGKDESVLAQLKELISSRKGFSLEFEEQADPEVDGVVRMERDIAADLAPGAYLMVVRVHDRRTNALTVAETNLVVVEH